MKAGVIFGFLSNKFFDKDLFILPDENGISDSNSSSSNNEKTTTTDIPFWHGTKESFYNFFSHDGFLILQIESQLKGNFTVDKRYVGIYHVSQDGTCYRNLPIDISNSSLKNTFYKTGIFINKDYVTSNWPSDRNPDSGWTILNIHFKSLIYLMSSTSSTHLFSKDSVKNLAENLIDNKNFALFTLFCEFIGVKKNNKC